MSDKETLSYYQGKVDELYKERLGWLSKFDLCASALAEKQKLMKSVSDQRQNNRNLNKNKVYHNIALIDEQLNVVRMQKDNIFNQYADAHEILKMEELFEEYPIEVDKKLPCKIGSQSNAQIIKNQLNIHHKTSNINVSLFRQQNAILKSKKDASKEGIASKALYKPTAEELLRKQISQIRTNQEKEMCLLEQQKKRLENLVCKARQAEQENSKEQNEMLEDLKKKHKNQQKIYRQLADKYFDSRQKVKKERQSTINEKGKLQSTLKIIEKKIEQETRIWEKQNKAKQTLIQRKSQDFQQDYKARMRAKQRNLQALRDNYEKMQEVCIEKIRNLEQALTKAKLRLNQTIKNGDEQINILKSQLNILEKQFGKQRLEKARLDEIMRQKIQKQKREKMQQEQRLEEQRRKQEKDRMIEQAYRQTFKPQQKSLKKLVKAKPKPKSGKKKPVNQPQSEEDDESSQQSMAMSDLQNIRQQINRLQSKVGK